MMEADSIPELLETEEDISEGIVVREELDLTGTIEEDVFVY